MDHRLNSADHHAKRLIALEFNELCPALLDRWMNEGLLPNFSQLHGQSEVFVTDADVDDPALLEPWIQWYSVHTGLPYEQHRVFHLTEGPKAGHADIYQMLLAAGRSVCSFASMNVAPFASEGSIFVGDPWSENGDAFPVELNVYNRFVSHNVREYSNANDKLGLVDYARFLAFMAGHGLDPATVAQIVRQLGTERLANRKLAWKRVALLDRLQFDVFASYYRRFRPDFASFFVNSVAHLQHSYWRHMDPLAFTVRPSADEMAIYGDAIRFGYQEIDRLLGRFMALARAADARLMFITALSQQPFLRHEETGGQHFYRLHDVRAFLNRLGIGFINVDPTMTHQYFAQFASTEVAGQARRGLESLKLADGRTVFGFPSIETASDSLYFGCQISTPMPLDAPVTLGQGNEPIRFGDLFYQIEAIKSGRHHPDGCLWIQTGRHVAHVAKPSILDILPTQLALLDVPDRCGALQGRNLLKELVSA
jgi:hypothetical protein